MADLEDWQTAAIEDAAASHTVGVVERRAQANYGERKTTITSRR